ncbi:phage scaffolding protein [Lactiplantibacillus carotarum]|uniref:phage scaffolding protein n=1 Tax=Lactiplantibacillus carotarum TaxID=2993456 RepID=UPI00298F11B4|nr:phage scaffolding protein [Lactiplantibacillus carotarum]
MERKDLDALGLDEKQATGVLKLYNAGLDPVKTKLTEAQTELDSTKQQVTDRDKQIETLGKQAGNSEKLNKQIADLQATITDNDAAAATNLQQVKTDNAIQLALRDAGVRDAKAVLPFIDQDTVKLGDDGKLTGISEQITGLKESHDYLFNADDGDKPKVKITTGGNPSGQAGGGEPTLAERITARMTADD